MEAGVGCEVVVGGAEAPPALADLLLAVEPQAAALTRSTVATAAVCATRSTDRDHMRNRPFVRTGRRRGSLWSMIPVGRSAPSRRATEMSCDPPFAWARSCRCVMQSDLHASHNH